MRRASRLFEQIIDRENLRIAIHKALRGKQSRADARAFLAGLDEILDALRSSLQDGTVVLGNRINSPFATPRSES